MSDDLAVNLYLISLLERVWRFGAKPDTDSAREAEKVVTEATFLCEALGGVPSFTMRDVARAAHDAGIEIKFSCDDPAARIAELERELDEAQADHARAQVHINELCLEPARLRSQAAQAERERDKWKERARMTERERDEARETLSRHASAHERHITALARDRDAYCELHAKARAKLNVMTDRYRPRRQSEEPAPEGESVLVCGRRGKSWTACRGAHVADTAFWTHQPPAPGEGE